MTRRKRNREDEAEEAVERRKKGKVRNEKWK
jgi:hypothetical protein